MKVNLTTTFLGVRCAGSTNRHEPDAMDKIQKQQEKAVEINLDLKEQGKDTFVVALSYTDARGNRRDEANTYVLYDEEAKLPQKYNAIKMDLIDMFKDDLAGDLFTNKLNLQLDEITKQQNKVAAFIAENRVEASEWRSTKD